MKKLNKVLVMVMAAIMTLAMSATVFAATQTKALSPADADNATITINNPANGETYTLYKLFDATVSADGQISYQGTVPSDLSAYFEADANGYISPKGDIVVTDASGKVTDTKMTDGLKTALEKWAKDTESAKVIYEVSDGSEALKFTGLPYGYYVMVTTHKSDKVGDAEAKSLISVTSTKPDATINDKNVNEPSAKKTVGKESYSIGDKITYTAEFDTTNYMTKKTTDGNDVVSKQVVEYVIEDTLPPFLSNVEIKSIEIGGTAWADAPSTFTDKKITIPWATKDTSVTPAKFTSLYAQGAKIKIVYEAVLTSTTNINAADTNTIKITPNVDDGNGNKEPWDKSWEDSTEITTYATALKKTDGSKALAGAKFAANGLTVEKTADGVYTVVRYDSASTTPGTEMEVGADGKLYIVGLASDVKLTVTETKAPEGYNKMDGTKELTPQVLNKQLYKLSGYEKYDEDGNLVEHKEESSTSFVEVTKNLNELDAAALEIINKPGVVLPGTGGIGTTIFYILGSLLVVGCGIVLVSRKRMQNNK